MRRIDGRECRNVGGGKLTSVAGLVQGHETTMKNFVNNGDLIKFIKEIWKIL